MKAVVKYGKGKGLIEIQEVPEPKIKDDEALIEVKAIKGMDQMRRAVLFFAYSAAVGEIVF